MTPPVDARSRPGRTVPVVAPATITALTAAGAIQTHRGPLIALALCVLAVVTGAVLVWMDATGWPLVAGLAVLAGTVTAACWGDPRNLGWFGMCVIAGWAALALRPRWAIAIGAVLAAAFVIMLAVVSREPGWVTWAFGVALTCGAFVFVRWQRKRVERLHATQSELAERARTDERHRIAREMHDLVGHSLTVALLHLGSARLALDDDIDAARAALAEAESATRDSLDDVRAAVGLMRSTDTAAAPPRPASPTSRIWSTPIATRELTSTLGYREPHAGSPPAAASPRTGSCRSPSPTPSATATADRSVCASKPRRTAPGSWSATGALPADGTRREQVPPR
nr:histidine kinase [Propionicimonas sp.]